jgi:hypothetical protein
MTTLNRRNQPAQPSQSLHRFATLCFAGALAVVVSLLSPGDFGVGAQAPDPCAPPNSNPVVCENQQPGAPSTEWDISGAGDSTIQGYSTDISVNRGQTISFKIDTDATSYQIDIYRMGYYSGFGARKVATVTPSATLPQTQPSCLSDPTTGLVDCGNWDVSASWPVPSTAVSGIYFAKLSRPDTGGASHIVFVVRDDSGRSDLLFQTSDTTWQAYNQYGGNSLYVGGPATNPGRAYKVSYNRPLTVRGTSPEDSVFNAEYPMVRWLEANGFNVSYSTGIDSDRSGAEILEHQAFLSVGHDEYWSGAQRASVEAARAAGVHLAFFSGNEVFWKTRWEDSLSAPAASYRTLVSYKETHANAKIDPLSNVWTGTWEDPRFSPPADGGRPSNSLTGTLFRVNSGTGALTVPAAEGKLRFWRNTAVANQTPGASVTLSDGTLGYEWDEDVQNAFRPAGLIRLSDTTMTGVDRLQDYGSTYASSTANHALTLYRHSSGALVFGAGTVQWSWGLDGNHERGPSTPSVAMQQATVNLFADMDVQPLTLQSGLTLAAGSTDTTKPASTITAPAHNSGVPANTFITISGTAADGEGGVVGAVEISADGGVTWLRATGRENWSISWQSGPTRTVTLFSRAVDDAGNVEVPVTGITLNVGAVPATCPCSLWHSSQQPTIAAAADSAPVEVGTRFRADVSGYVTAIRFFKSAQNTGAHVGNLWTDGGVLLSTVTFVGESVSGWQEATLDTPVQIAADTTYVVSYHTTTGHYAADGGFFATNGLHSGPLHAPRDGEFGANGVFNYGASSFPTETFGSENFWVDLVFVTSVGPDTAPPTLITVNPPNGAADAGPATVVSGTFNERIDPSSVTSSTFELRDSGNALVPATIGYSATTRSATLTPGSVLTFSATYTATLRGGSTGIKDVAGNALASDVTWSFTTGWPTPPPPTAGPGGPILVISSAANPFTQYYAEILRAEGLNGFLVSDIASVTAPVLAAHDVVILGEIALTPTQVNLFVDWVSGGGKLIAMRPDKQLAALLGVTDAGTTLSDAYLKIDTSIAPGAGIVSDTMQFHGAADRYTLNGATAVAALYSSSTSATSAPAVTVRSVGASGGQAAAFTYDLARSIVYTRQGNPAWAGQERDGITPIRSDELFFGGTEPDYVDRTRIAIPQADEQQRLLANLIGYLTTPTRPLPRFWYFPRGEKAVVVMTGDDHASNGTAGRFDVYKSNSPANCNVDDWECVRATSYIYPSTPISNAQVAAYVADGFEVGVHVTTGCGDYTAASLQSSFASDLASFSGTFPSAPPTRTSRTHCIAWSDYDTQPQVEAANGIRLDTNYYYWPGPWVQDTPGFMTGSGMPMRFAKADGTLIDVYQAATQMTDESDQTWPFTIDTLLDRALGAEGYYGFFTANMHTDTVAHIGSEAIVAAAQARGVPVISARQLLGWLDGRNEATYTGPSWTANTLTFTVSADARANGLQMLLPSFSSDRVVTAIRRDAQPIPFTLQQIKGVNYAVFAAVPGAYGIDYGVDNTPPTLNALAVTPDATEATVTWTTSEAASSRVEYGPAANNLLSSSATGDLTMAHSVTLHSLIPGTTYYFRASSTDTAGNTATAPTLPTPPASFITLVTPTLGCPCTIWSLATVPSLPSVADTRAVEVGLKFRPTANGYVTAIRFYKGPLNTGSHIGNLWTSGGTLLGSVTFTNETSTGWQQAALPQPVAVIANTTYVVSYHTSTGGHAFDPQYFQSTGVTNGPLQALAEGVDGSNGVFRYGSSAFPGQSSGSPNYWVDLEFVTSVPPSPPSVGVTDTTTADFAGGTVGAGTSIAGFAGGELILSPSMAEELTGPGLPSGWSSAPWAGGGTISLASGRVTIDGSLLTSGAPFGPEQSLEFVAIFSADAAQHGGFGQDFADDHWAIFSTGEGGGLSCRTRDGLIAIDTPLPGSWLGDAHRFRIDWTSATVRFYIDGALVATHTQSILGQMRPAFSDFNVGGDGLALEAVRMAPYATTGTFTSRILDAGGPTDWANAVSVTEVPTGTTLSLSVRFGNTPVPDGTWSTFESLALGNAAISGNSRYAQYHVVMSGTGIDTPALESITLSPAGVPPVPGLSVTDATLSEGGPGTAHAVFTISLSAPTSHQVSVSYATSDGTAVAGSDYEAVSGTIIFPAGATSRTVLVPIAGDTATEAHETFLFTLSAQVNATLADGQGTGTIENDDFPSLSIADVSVTEGDSGTANAVFTVSLSTPGYQDVSVAFATSNGSAISSQDYTTTSGTLTFPAGTTTRQVTVPVVGDTRNEVSETFGITLSSLVNATMADATATGTIIDNDPVPSLAITDVSVAETDGAATATFAVTLSAASGQTVTVSYATADDTATSPADYAAASGSVIFAAGEITKLVAVTVVGDTLDEPTETFRVNLSSPVNATIADAQGNATIVDNDPDLPAASTRMAIDRTALFFGSTNNGALKTTGQPVSVTFSGGTGAWSVTSSATWVNITGGSGAGAGTFTVAVKAGTYPSGTVLSGTITVTAPGVPNSPLSFPIELRAYATTSGPKGFVDSPAKNAQVVGAIGVTGWAIDDIGVSHVSLWRDPIAGETGSAPNGKVFIGNAVQVDGTRPDVDAAQSKPFDFRAGWGYLLLTNMLPNQGNGTFTLFVYADDPEGHTVLLGSRTITCDNAHSPRPFGAIDTPNQGETISGTAYLNFGWVLTPLPNTVPTNGSTIMVYIDGVPVGHPTYDQFRGDIAALFPGRNNSGGAVGYFILDTTTLSNGVHTIAWGVTDSAGNAEGIGSRYFTVLNGASVSSITVERSSSTQSAMGQALEVRASAETGGLMGDTAETLLGIPLSQTPVYLRTGFDQTAPLNIVDRDSEGVNRVEARQMERFQLTLGAPVAGSADRYEGYVVAGSRLNVLPSGSFLDRESGEFFWQPGVGFAGDYQFVFVRISGQARESVPVKAHIRER